MEFVFHVQFASNTRPSASSGLFADGAEVGTLTLVTTGARQVEQTGVLWELVALACIAFSCAAGVLEATPASSLTVCRSRLLGRIGALQFAAATVAAVAASAGGVGADLFSWQHTCKQSSCNPQCFGL